MIDPNQRKLTPRDEVTDFLLYTAPDGQVKVECILHDETIWLPQKRIAELFGVPAISKHLENIYADGELVREATVSILETVQQEGSRQVKRKLEFYNVDAIISVGYRVNSSKATQFRIWATQLLKEYITKGFAMDDERLKNGRFFGKDYFRELLERVRSIRASERRIYQQITDIFAECSIDYDPRSETTRNFYAHVQDKFHFAITGHTAAEIIYLNADAEKPLMGMMTYKNAPNGRVLKSDTAIGKNYLQEDEIKKLERTVTAFFDYIERIIENRTTFTMESFAESVNRFLEFNEYIKSLRAMVPSPAKRPKKRHLLNMTSSTKPSASNPTSTRWSNSFHLQKKEPQMNTNKHELGKREIKIGVHWCPFVVSNLSVHSVSSVVKKRFYND